MSAVKQASVFPSPDAALAVLDRVAEKEMKAPSPLSRQLAWEIEAAKELLAQIAELSKDDPDFARDMVEGSTNVREIIAKMVEEDAADDAIIEGLSKAVDRFEERQARIKRRISIRRTLILQGLRVAGLKKLETPTGTVSVRPVAQSLIVIEEADIPAEFWKQPPPVLDKRALLAAAKEAPVPGVTLSNGGETISLRP